MEVEIEFVEKRIDALQRQLEVVLDMEQRDGILKDLDKFQSIHKALVELLNKHKC